MAGDQKKAAREGRTLVWIDEAGFYLLPSVVRTYAPCGQTPILHAPLSYDHVSAISAITPEGQLLIQMQETAYHGTEVVRFLKHLLRHIAGKVLILWDGASIHQCQAIKDFLAAPTRQAHPSGAVTRLCARAHSRRRNLAVSQAYGVEECRVPQLHRSSLGNTPGNSAAPP